MATVVLVTVVALATLDFLPAVLGGEPRGVVRYSSLQEVEAGRGVHLWRPRTLPAPVEWPPAYLRVAIADPGWVQMVFLRPGRADALTICQALAGVPSGTPPAVPDRLLERGDVLQEDAVIVAGRTMQLRRVLLADGAIVHELWWREYGRPAMMRLRGPVDDLMRLASHVFEDAR